MGTAPRLVTFPDGAYCEAYDSASLNRLLHASGQHDSWTVRWQFDLRAVVLATGLCVFFGLAAYRYGLLDQRPPGRANPAGHGQRHQFSPACRTGQGFPCPSRLPTARQAEISRRFEALQAPDDGVPAYEIVFRANRRLPANAFALPSGTLILTDDLVKLAKTDNHLMAVLAHELGHVQARHGLRLVIQAFRSPDSSSPGSSAMSAASLQRHRRF